MTEEEERRRGKKKEWFCCLVHWSIWVSQNRKTNIENKSSLWYKKDKKRISFELIICYKLAECIHASLMGKKEHLKRIHLSLFFVVVETFNLINNKNVFLSLILFVSHQWTMALLLLLSLIMFIKPFTSVCCFLHGLFSQEIQKAQQMGKLLSKRIQWLFLSYKQ